jgi:predicted Zn-ribbon and HTH transcriptional regulator
MVMVFGVVCITMRLQRGEFERIRAVLMEVEPEEPLTAREILVLLDEHGEPFDSTHQIATILGRHTDAGVEVIQDQPYRYRLNHN